LPDFTDLVMQIRNSGLPEREKAELEKRLIREGPSMDVDRAIEAAFNPPTSTPSLPPHKHTQTEPPPKVIYVEKKSPQGNLGSGLITLIIFGLIFYYGFLRPDYSSSTSSSIYKTSSPATRSVSIFVSANQLHKDYETNEVAADLKCKNKTVVFTAPLKGSLKTF